MNRFLRQSSFASCLAAACLTQLPQLAIAQQPAKAAPAATPIYGKIIKSVAFIHCSDEDGKEWHGTGWVLDAKRRLIVTNHHVIEGVEECTVYFPEFDGGKLVTDMEESLTEERAIKGRIVDSDMACDLAIVQLESLPADAKALPRAKTSAEPGMRVHSIAGNCAGSTSLWIYSTGFVRQIARGTLANGYDSVLLESDMATNQGNSGGPVVNDNGELVAVVEGHSTQARLMSIYVDLEALNDYLEDGLKCVEPKTAEQLQFAAERHLSEGRPGVALKLVTAALKLEKKSAKLYVLRGLCFCEQDDYDAAEQDFKHAISIDKECADAHCGLGEIARMNEDYEAAIGHFTTALRLDPENADFLVRRGNARWETGEMAKARQDFTAALKLDEELVEAERGLAFVDIEEGNFKAGIERLDPIFDEFSDDAEACYMAGRGFEGLNNVESAINLYRRAIELDETYSDAYRELGGLLVIQQQLTPAIEVLTAGLKLDEEDSMMTYFLGAALVANGEAAKGKGYLEQALELDPENEELKAGTEKILAGLKE